MKLTTTQLAALHLALERRDHARTRARLFELQAACAQRDAAECDAEADRVLRAVGADPRRHTVVGDGADAGTIVDGATGQPVPDPEAPEVSAEPTKA